VLQTSHANIIGADSTGQISRRSDDASIRSHHMRGAPMMGGVFGDARQRRCLNAGARDD
jgi:hypothetical protein